MKKNSHIIGFITLLLLVVFMSGCTTTSNNTTSNQSNQNVIVQITANSPWNGTLIYNGTNYKINGTKNQNYNLGKTPGDVNIYLNKHNDTGNLTVQLLQGSNIIQTKTISSQQEFIDIKQNF
jgi:hypothetical protein